MTSSSSLFYNRRYRAGRTLEGICDGLDLGPPSPVDRHNRRHRNRSSAGGNYSRRDRLNPDGCDLAALRRLSAHLPSRQPQEPEITSVQDGGGESYSGNVDPPGHRNSSRSRLAFGTNERLPGAVLLARERLLQRLRGVQLSSTRQSSGSSSRSSINDIQLGDDLRFVDAGDWETEIAGEWLSTISPLTYPNPQETIKRPAGLTVEALHSLPVEVFPAPDEGEECSICLELFSVGEQLIRLQCGHRYHFCCLCPWVQTCGDCPYCRQSI